MRRPTAIVFAMLLAGSALAQGMLPGILAWKNTLGGTAWAGPTNGLVSYWPFTGNANDDWGVNNGTVVGATLAAGPSGADQTAYSFDGNDYIDCGNDNSLKFQSNITISAWIKTETADRSVVDKYDDTGYGPLFKLTDSGSLYFVSWDATVSKLFSSTGTVSVINNQWRHVAVTASIASGNIIYYVDGSPQSTTDSDRGTKWGTTTSLRIGMRNRSGSEKYFIGLIDEVRVYSRVLASNEIAVLKQQFD